MLKKDRWSGAARIVGGIQPHCKSKKIIRSWEIALTQFFKDLVEFCFSLGCLISFLVAVARIGKSEDIAGVGPVFVSDPFALWFSAFIIGMAIIETTIQTDMKVTVARIACIPEADAVRRFNLSLTVKTDLHALLKMLL